MKISAKSAPISLVAEFLRWHSPATCIICFLVHPQGQFGTVQVLLLGKGMGRNTLLLSVSSCLCLTRSPLGMLHVLVSG